MLRLSLTVSAILKDSEGRESRVKAMDIDAKLFEKTSLMPAGVVGRLSSNDLALLAYLGDRKERKHCE